MDSNDFSTFTRSRKLLKTFIGIVIAAVVVFAGIYALRIYGDYLEVAEIGANFVDVFWKNLFTKAAFQIGTFCMVFLLTFFSTWMLRKNLAKCQVAHTVLNRPFLILILSVVISLLAGGYVSGTVYEKFLQLLHATPFQLTDPLFGQDIGYYVFVRPFLMLMIESFLGIWILLTVYLLAAYFILYFRIGERNVVDFIKCRPIITHLVVNILVYLVVKAFSIWITSQNVLFSKFGDLTGGGYVSVNVWLNYYRFAPFILLAIAIVAIVLLVRGRVLPAIITCASYLGILLVVWIVSGSVQLFHVSPNEVAVEAPYIQNNINYTRKGYNIDQITETEFPIEENLDDAKLSQNKETIDNIRIVDFPATLTATNQLQGLRNYYNFNDLDIGLYNINGKKTAVGVAPREIDQENLEDSAKNYINERFRFTHGYGVAMTSITTVDSQGQPDYYIKDLLPQQREGIPYVTQPRVYYGELTNHDVIVNTKTRELDYSDGARDEEFDYDGNAGIRLNFFNKLIYAFRTGDFRMLIANQITSESRLLINRNVIERLNKVAPFIRFDGDPAIVIDDDGTLKWVVDGYTYTDQFPYSQRTENFNYIRHSVKAVVDAYQGTTKLYVIDETDPIVSTYRKIYPTLFESGRIPQSIMSKSKYPEWLFSTQCKIYAQYHNTNPTIFYNKNDMYAVANEKYSQEIKPIEPYYNLMQLDEFNDQSSELIMMLPFTIVNRDNMVSWIAVGCEGENYGKLVAYKFPKTFNIYGPLQVENMIDNSPDISREMTLWNSGGSNVIRGNLLVIPLSGTILYVEPVYLTSNNQASLPSLKRIIVAYGDNVVMEKDLSTALSKVFHTNVTVDANTVPNTGETTTPGSTPPPSPTPLPSGQSGVQSVDAVVNAYNELETQAKSGNWEGFGKALDEMKKAVEELEKNSQKND